MRRTRPSMALMIAVIAYALASGCATSRRAGPPSSGGYRVAETALSMIGKPYQWGGRSPQGFDCSGLVIYSYRAAGISGLPHSVRRLQEIATPLRLSQLEAGDLLFFDLSGVKTSHVAIYVGQRHFVHAPSSGRPVERVSFNQRYWAEQLKAASAGRIRH